MNSTIIGNQNYEILRYEKRKTDIKKMYFEQKDLIVKLIEEVLNTSSSFMISEDQLKFKSLLESKFIYKQSSLQLLLQNQEEYILTALDQLYKTEKSINLEIARKFVRERLDEIYKPKEINLQNLNLELKNVVIDKFIEKITYQANQIIEKNKEIERIKGNFEKLMKKNDKQVDISIDSMVKKDNENVDLMPSLDISHIANISTDQILYHNKNKILKNINQRVNKINKLSQLSTTTLNGNDINHNKTNNESDAFHKKLDFGKFLKDGNPTINIERINSLESISKYQETNQSGRNNLFKKENVKISQSPIRNSNFDIEKEFMRLENNEKKRKLLNAKPKNEILSIKRNTNENSKKEENSKILLKRTNENKSRSLSNNSKNSIRSISPNEHTIKSHMNSIKDKKVIAKTTRDFGKFINSNKKISHNNKISSVTPNNNDKSPAITKIEIKYKRKESIEKKPITPAKSSRSVSKSQKPDLDISLNKSVKKKDNGIKENVKNDETINSSLLNNSIDSNLSKIRNNKNKSNGKLDIAGIELAKNSGNVKYTERLLNKYYQFLDSINKKYDNDTDVKTIKNKEKDKKNIFTINEENPTTKNDSSTSLIKIDSDFNLINKNKLV